MEMLHTTPLFEATASICHTANTRLQVILGEQPSMPWDDLDDHTRESAIEGVRKILSGEISTPEQSHESWLAFKREAGWTYGTHKDPENKTHPCMVPYDELPADQRLKDALYFGIVRALESAFA